jgi:hypothetical protein
LSIFSRDAQNDRELLAPCRTMVKRAPFQLVG